MDMSVNTGAGDAARNQMRLVSEELRNQQQILRENSRLQEKIQRGGGGRPGAVSASPTGRSTLGIQQTQASIESKEQFSRQFKDEVGKLRDRADAEERGTGLGRREFRRGTRIFEILQGAGGGPQGNLSLLRGLVEEGAGSKLGASIGLGKVASTMSAFSGPLMIGAMVAEQAIQIYQARVENENATQRIMGENIDAARDIGLTGETRKRLARDVAARNDIRRRTSLENQAQSMSPRAIARIFEDVYDRATGVYDKEDQEEQKHVIAALEKAAKDPQAIRRLVDIDEVKRRSGNDQSLYVDMAYQIMLEDTKKLKSIASADDERKKLLARQQFTHEFRATIDPLYAAQYRNLAGIQKATEQDMLDRQQQWNEY